MTQLLTHSDLAQFTGTENYYRHFSGLLYTDGVKFLASRGGAYWLLDLIGSYQGKCRRDPRLAEFQLWEITVNDGTGVVTCSEDSGKKPVIKQRLDYTDFPLSGVKFYVRDGVLMLTSEY